MKKPENASPSINASAQQRNAWSLALVVVFFDQLTKFLVVTFFSSLVIRNTGTAFGFFGGNNILLTIISLAIIGLLLRHMLRQEKSTKMKRIVALALMLVIGGGVGNITDRLLHGYVIDFIKVPLWPAFNIADMCVTLGITILLWQTLFKKATNSEL